MLRCNEAADGVSDASPIFGVYFVATVQIEFSMSEKK
jgi:hypothetical protein